MASYYRKAAELIIGFEGFSSTPYGDVNNYRIGFGSSTYMLAVNSTPLVLPKYTPTKDPKRLNSPRINIQQAAYDLRRRLVGEFEVGIRTLVNTRKAGLYERLSDEAKAALLSIAYNFGSIIRPNGVPLADLVAQSNGSNTGIASAIRQIQARTPQSQLALTLRRAQEADYVEGKFTPVLRPGVDYSIFDDMRTETDTPRAESRPGRSSDKKMSPYVASFKSFHPRIQYELTRRKFSTETVDAHMPFVNFTSLLYVNRTDTNEALSNTDAPASTWGWCPSLGVHTTGGVKNIRFEQLYNPTVNISQLQNRSIVGVITRADQNGVSRVPGLLAASTEIEVPNIPPPGIANITVDRTLAGPMGVRGGLIRANLKVIAYSKGQVDTLLKYFLRPGTNVVLELGRMSTKNQELKTFNWNRPLTEIKSELEGIVQLRDNDLQNKLIRDYVYGNNGNYEIFVGYTVKFNIKYTKENIYEIEFSVNSIQQFEIQNTHTGVKSICASPTNRCAAMDAREYFSPAYSWKEKTFSRLLKAATTSGGNLYDEWNQHVVPVKDTSSEGATSAGTEQSYFITWKFFIDKVLNDENLGLLSIFPLASRNTIKSGLLSPSTTEGEIIKNNEALIINEVNYHPDLRSIDPNVMIIVNKQAQANAEVQQQFRLAEAQYRAKTQDYDTQFDSPLERRLLQELDMDDFAPAEQALRNVSGVSSLLRGVWLNTNAIIAAFDRTDTVSSALDALLVEMNRVTEGYWNLQLLSSDDSKFPGVHVIDMGLSKTITIEKPPVAERDSLLTNITAPQSNKEAILANTFGSGDTPRYIYVFNERNRILNNGDSIGSELIDININFDLPLAIATQVIAGVGGPAQKGTVTGIIDVEELESLKLFPSLSNICGDSEPANARCVYDPSEDLRLRLDAIDANYQKALNRIEQEFGDGLIDELLKQSALDHAKKLDIQARNNVYRELGRYASVQNQFADLGDFGSTVRFIEINPSSMVKRLNADATIGDINGEPETANKKRPVSHAWNSSNLTKALIDLTLPGIGGIQLFQTFLVDKVPTILQQGYYVVVKVTHEFTTQNGWITKLQGRFRYMPPEE